MQSADLDGGGEYDQNVFKFKIFSIIKNKNEIKKINCLPNLFTWWKKNI